METATNQTNPPLVNATCKLGEKGCYGNGKCHWLGNCENKITSNADRIRAMSDEELATVLYDCDSLGYCSSPPECGDLLETSEGIPKEKCIDCVLAWLRQPTKGE